MTYQNATLDAWKRLSKWPAGQWLFSRWVCFKAPYFASISPHIVLLAPGQCHVQMHKRRAVQNHIGTVHAIAMCNMAELSAGLATEATVPVTHRWIPKSMQVNYLKKTQTNLIAKAQVSTLLDLSLAIDVPVRVEVSDLLEELVFSAVVTMRVSPQ
jgi:acyl-coenzyme A thioesterase PaaI-like protein